MNWREINADQNLRMANKMLEQQGEINELTAENTRLRAELTETRAFEARVQQRTLTDAIEAVCNAIVADLHPDVRRLLLGDELWDMAKGAVEAALPHLHYWSTACQHGKHAECRLECKYGDTVELCKCSCHQSTSDSKEPT